MDRDSKFVGKNLEILARVPRNQKICGTKASLILLNYTQEPRTKPKNVSSNKIKLMQLF